MDETKIRDEKTEDEKRNENEDDVEGHAYTQDQKKGHQKKGHQKKGH